MGETGHRSDAVRLYKRTVADGRLEAIDIVQGVKNAGQCRHVHCRKKWDASVSKLVKVM